MNPPPPFACTYTPSLADLLATLDCTLAISSCQAGKVMLLSPHPGGGGLFQFPRSFLQPMGIAVSGDRLAIATRDQVKLLGNARGLARRYHQRPDTYDSLFIPRAAYHTGALDLHDLCFTPGGLLAVNTSFSCLCRPDPFYNFIPVWQPPFITALAPEDRCHLNGLALAEGAPRWVTALGATDTAEGWRATRHNGGVVVDVPGGEIVARDLPMPHSPRVWHGELHLLLSATGELVRLDPASGRTETITRLPGFARGLARCGDYAFAGVSRLRRNHKFGDLPIASQPPFCGVVAIHLPGGSIVGSIEYKSTCEEIYDVQVLHGTGRSAILREDDPFCTASLSLPDQVFWADEPAGESRRSP